ncbi:MAG: hypothetical protein QM820_30195 [Minicystis sp.]
MLLRVVAEHEEDPGRHRDRLAAQRLLEVLAQLLLCEILLERPARRQHAVAEQPVLLVRRPPADERRDREHFSRERIRAGDGLAPLAHVLDHVDHEAEVHHVGLALLVLGSEVRVPASRVEAELLQESHVVPAPAAVIEDRPAPVEIPVAEERLHRRRQAVSLQRRAVALHRHRGGLARLVADCRQVGGFFPLRLDDPVTFEADAEPREPRLPRLARANRLHVRKEPDPLGRCRERGHLREPRMIRRQHRLLAVQDRRVPVRRIRAIRDGARVEIDRPARRQHGERLLEEAGVSEQGQPPSLKAELHDLERAGFELGQHARRLHGLLQLGRQMGQGLDVRIDPVGHSLAHGQRSHLPREGRAIHAQGF